MRRREGGFYERIIILDIIDRCISHGMTEHEAELMADEVFHLYEPNVEFEEEEEV